MKKIAIKDQEYDAFQLLTLLYLHFSFDNLAVVLPLEQSIDKIKRKHFQIIWTCNKKDGELYIPNYFYDQFIKYLKDDNIRYIVSSLHLHSCYYVSEGGHANILLFDKKTNQIDRFEPNGKIASMDKQWYNSNNLDKKLKEFFESTFKGVKYISPKEFMPNEGPQLLQINENIQNKNIDPNGFCVGFCTLYVEMRVNGVTRDVVIKKINNISCNLTDYIRKYSDHILNISI